MKDLSDVKIGDILYIYGFGVGQSTFIKKVDRITPTLVITDDGRRFSKKNGRLLSSTKYHVLYARLATSEDMQNIRTNDKRVTLRSLTYDRNFNHLTEDELDIVISILNNAKQRKIV